MIDKNIIIEILPCVQNKIPAGRTNKKWQAPQIATPAI